MNKTNYTNKFINNLVNHPYFFLSIIISLTIIASFGITNLKIDFSPQYLFEADDIESKKLERMDKIFGKEDKLIMILLKSDNIFSSKVIQYIKELSDQIKSIKEIESVESLTHLTTARTELVDNEETLIIDNILNEKHKTISAEIANEIKEKILKWSIAKGFIYTENHNYTVIAAEINSETNRIGEVTDVVEKIENILKSHPPAVDIDINLAGIPYFRVEVIRSLIQNQIVTIPLTYVIFFGLLYFMFRRYWMVVFQLCVAGISLIWGLGVMGATGESINIINNIIGTVIFVIVVSDTVHFLIRYDREQQAGLTSIEALKKSMSLLIMACFLTSFTSAVGFASLIAARTSVLKSFGIYLGLAIIIAYPVTIILLSALLKLFPQKTPVHAKTGLKFDSKMEKLGLFVIKRPKSLLVGGFIIIAVSIAFASTVKVDTHAMNMFTENNPIKITNDIMENKFIGIIPLSIMIESEQEDMMKQPSILQKIEQLQKKINGIMGIKVSLSLADYVKEFNHIMGDATKTVPDSKSMVSQLLALAEMSSDNLPLSKVVNFDYSKTRIRTWLPDNGGASHIKGFEKIKGIINQIFTDTENIKVSLSGSGYVAALNLDYLVRDLFASLLLASLIIFFVIGVLFRSLKIGLLSIIPNMMPLIVTIGYMGIRNLDLNVSTVIIFSISLGMAVDSTIHFIARFLETKKTNSNCDASLILAFKSSGKAIIFTTFLFLCGFLILLISDFVPVRLFAELTSITLFTALIGDLIILPSLLKIFYTKKNN